MPQLIRVHRDEKDIGFFTRETAIESLRAGILRSDDWAFCEGLSDWIFLGHLLEDWAEFQFITVTPPPLPILVSPPPLPPPLPSKIYQQQSLLYRSRTKAQKNNTVVVMIVVAACLVGLLVVALLFGSPQSDSSLMPYFEGDSRGNPSGEDLRNGAEWLLEQDRLRERQRRR